MCFYEEYECNFCVPNKQWLLWMTGRRMSSITLHPFHLEETKNMSLFFILKSGCFSWHVDAATPLHVGLDRANMAGAEVLQVTSSDCSVILLYDFMLLHISPGSWSGSTSPTSWSTSASSQTPAPSDWRRSPSISMTSWQSWHIAPGFAPL